jgi:hypothetical protein
MKKLATLAVLTASTITALAGQPMVDKNPTPPAPEVFYNAGEFAIGASAIVAAKTGSLQFNGDFGSSANWGVGLEGSYFVNRNFGLGVEAQYVAVNNPFWASNLNFYLRGPLSESSRWAPYLLAGLGGIYSSGNGRFQGFAGAGIEYRFTPKIGAFGDARHAWVSGSEFPNYGLFRLGFKFVF